jgi:hypothetical protein
VYKRKQGGINMKNDEGNNLKNDEELNLKSGENSNHGGLTENTRLRLAHFITGSRKNNLP